MRYTSRMPKQNDIPLSLYIHLPWCVRKCPYCDFNSHALRGESIPDELYVDTLLQELDAFLPMTRPIHSIFFGGGTPSLFSGDAITRLLQALQQKLTFSADIEITLEANPGTVEQDHFHAYRAAGINRLSIGVQSFQDHQLKQLGRIHGSDEAKQAFATARKAGFDNINIDLMFGLPGQTLADAQFDLKTAIALQPQHISWYQLTLEPNTYFHRFPPTLPDNDAIWQIQQGGQSLLQKNNYQQYEISAYAKNNKRCRHNLNYWLFGDYLGLGAGAHSKLTLADNSIQRHWNIKHPKQYLKRNQAFIAEKKILPPKDCAFEFMLNTLRLKQSVAVELFAQRTGLTLTSLEPALQKAQQQGLLTYDTKQLQTTEHGQRYLNNLLEILLPD